MSKLSRITLALFQDDFFYLAGQPASMSFVLAHTIDGTVYNLIAAFGNDGIYRPPGNSSTFLMVPLAHTEEEDNPWWMVDIEGVYCICAVNIQRRNLLNIYYYMEY